MERKGVSVTRKSDETNITVYIQPGMDKTPDEKFEIGTGIGFFNHCLCALAKHSNLGLDIKADGDLDVDGHHTVEDVGIVLGLTFKELFHDKKGGYSGIARYGTASIPMDEALAFCSLDISGRAYLVFDADFNSERCGDFDTCLTEEFFRAFAVNAGITLHIRKMYGKNDHHVIEAMFKAVAHSLKAALMPLPGVLSTKGVL